MGVFDFFKKKQIELTVGQRKWNKMWELWSEEKAITPYAQLMTYHGEVNNGGHDQYFTNVEITSDLQKEMSVLETILPPKHQSNLQKAYRAYLALEVDEHAEGILEQCDNTFYENEAELNRILEMYAATIEL